MNTVSFDTKKRVISPPKLSCTKQKTGILSVKHDFQPAETVILPAKDRIFATKEWRVNQEKNGEIADDKMMGMDGCLTRVGFHCHL